MILTNRLFARKSPSREAKSIYIFCEGAKREYQYFLFFKEMDSRINIEVYKLSSEEDNSPLGLLAIAKNCLIATASNPNPKYSFQTNDEVWIVFDTDKDKEETRKPQIAKLKEECSTMPGWIAAQSNPCFEVWLHYHFCCYLPEIEDIEVCSNWKQKLNELSNGGFDSRKHPIFIEDAAVISEKNFLQVSGSPQIGSTELHKLAHSILPIVREKISKALQQIAGT